MILEHRERRNIGMGFIQNFLTAGQDKMVKKYQKQVDIINSMEPEIQQMSTEEIADEIKQTREQVANGDGMQDYINRIFALTRELVFRNNGKRAYDVQLIAALALNDGHIAEAQTGEGKHVPLYTKIPTPKGWTTAGEVKVGDELFGLDGKPTKVIGVFPQGEKTIYKLTLKDGRVVECGDQHLWSVYDGYGSKELKTMTTEEMYECGINHYKKDGSVRGYQFHLPVAEAVHYEEQELPLDPYVMGLMLGDGCKNANGNFELSCADEDIENVKAIAKEINAIHYRKHIGTHTWIFYSVFNGNGKNKKNKCVKVSDIVPQYYELLSQKYCYEKWIPEEYKIASIEQRWALIQGLMDSDGNIYEDSERKRYNIQFSTTSPRLRDDIMEILYSLGCSCHWRLSRKAGIRNAKRDQYTISIQIPHEIKPNFFRLSRKKQIAEKASQCAPRKKDYTRIAITNIEKTTEQTEQVCFAVDSEDHLFLVGDYVATHNTLMSNFASLANAIAGKQVHVVTVNEYLSGRDAALCKQAIEGSGLTVGYIYNQQPRESKVEAYSCDIVYGTPSEFGFDYLRDNMVDSEDKKVQTHHDYAIIDEIDSILIDEARTPLIISGAGSKDVSTYVQFAQAVKQLHEGIDFDMKEKDKTISATEVGLSKVEAFLGIDDLYSDATNQYPRYLKQALTAQFLYHNGKDYIIEDGEVKIVDPNTGRIMEGRRWSEGLHQAIEAKEHVRIQQENDTMATVTLQNFFRLYDKLSGMTGTAMTEDAEFRKTYGMGVVAIPTNKPTQRTDMPDVIYKDINAKFNAIAEQIEEYNKQGRPVLVGTASVESSERLSRLLRKRGIKHELLNAKNHEREAHIIAQAGREGAVTIATNMAGRGTDIILGGNIDEMVETFKQMIIMTRPVDPETGVRDEYIDPADVAEARRQIAEICDEEKEKVLEAGGLAVIGSERHDSRRIDNQLRGRSGRQGDPGSSQFFISLEDDLMRLFGQDKMENIQAFMNKANLPDDMPLDQPMVSKAIERAQRQVESYHYEIRKHTLEYDDVLNKQRLAIYAERDVLLGSDNSSIENKMERIQNDVASHLVEQYCENGVPADEWDFEKLRAAYAYTVNNEESAEFISSDNSNMQTYEDAYNTILEHIKMDYDKKKEMLGDDLINQATKQVMLHSVDNAWKEHLTYMSYLKNSVGMRRFGQRDPLVEYKEEAYRAFEYMVDTMYSNVLTTIMRIAVVNADDMLTAMPPRAANDLANERIAIPGSKMPTGGGPLKTKPENKFEEVKTTVELGDDEQISR